MSAGEVKPEKSRGSGKSCLLYGCLFSFLAIVVLIVVVGVVGWRFVSGQVEKYTADAPAELPTVNLSEEEVAAIQERVDTFNEQLEQGESPEDLVLTADEINALIAKEEDLNGRVYVTIQDGQVAGDVSIPTDAIPGGKGRYFNASAAFDVQLNDGWLVVTLVSAEVKGEPVPDEFLQAMANKNLAEDLYDNPEVAETLRRFDSIEIGDGRIILRAKAADSDEDGQMETLDQSDSGAEPNIDLSEIEEQDPEPAAPE